MCYYSIDQFSYNAQTLAHGLATDADSSIQLSVGASADFDIKWEKKTSSLLA